MATDTMLKFGYPDSLVHEYAHWVVLIRPKQVTMGALVSDAVMRDLSPGSTGTRVGRWAFLDRAIPAVYAAPVFFHYLNHFA